LDCGRKLKEKPCTVIEEDRHKIKKKKIREMSGTENIHFTIMREVVCEKLVGIALSCKYLFRHRFGNLN
jgi:hypothetical protein